MKFSAVLICCLSLECSPVKAVDFRQIFHWDSLKTEKQAWKTISEAYPDLERCAYRWDGQTVFWIFRDPGSGRVLMHLMSGVIVRSEIRINGKLLEKPFTKPATLLVSVPSMMGDGSKKDSGEVSEVILGYWIPLRKSDRFRALLEVERPIRSKLLVRYAPESGWQLSASGKLDD